MAFLLASYLDYLEGSSRFDSNRSRSDLDKSILDLDRSITYKEFSIDILFNRSNKKYTRSERIFFVDIVYKIYLTTYTPSN